MGIKDAQEWLRTGHPPAKPTYVEMPDFEPSPDFVRADAVKPGERGEVEPGETTFLAIGQWVLKGTSKGSGINVWRNTATKEVRYQNDMPGSRKAAAPDAAAAPRTAAVAPAPVADIGQRGDVSVEIEKIPEIVTKPAVTIAKNLDIRKKASGDGHYWRLYIGGKAVGHIGGFENTRDDAFEATNVELDEDQRGKGLFQPFLQHVADQYPDGVLSDKFQTSRSFTKAMRKMPTFWEDERSFHIRPSQSPDMAKKEEPPEVKAAREYKELGTRAPAFKAWFGDWEHDPANASKVVNSAGGPQETHEIPGTGSVVKDAEGKPIVVYHGTAKGGFQEFRKDKMGDLGALYYGPGFYFTEDRDVADEYKDKGVTWSLAVPEKTAVADLKKQLRAQK